MELAVSSGVPVRPSFYTKLVFTFATKGLGEGRDLECWDRFLKLEDQFGYFSRCRIETNEEFQRETEGILVWKPDEKGITLPLVYTLQLNTLSNRRWLTGLGQSIGPLELTQVDLIPLKDGARAIMGLLFAGGECSVQEYLQWVSYRTFGNLKLSRRRVSMAEPSAVLGGLVRELQAAINENREPQFNNMTKRKSVDEARVCQYLLSGPDVPSWSMVEADPAFEAAWELVRTISRLSPEYPKYSRGDGRGQWMWSHDQASATRYGISEKGVTAWAHARDLFNRDTKPRVFMQSNYLQWVVAEEMAGPGKKSPQGIALRYTQDVRRLFFERCFEFFSTCP